MPHTDGEQAGGEEVFLSGGPPHQGSFQGEGGPDGGLHAQQRKGHFYGETMSRCIPSVLSSGFYLDSPQMSHGLCRGIISTLFSLLQIPETLHKGVSDKLASLAQGMQPDVMGKRKKH